MLPLRLEIKNFLPYRSPDPIHLEGLHLACLTGNNGAGKSSLLDAITWALWGRARARREDDLIHLGQTEMYVQLDFEQEGVVYRVLRQRRGGKKAGGQGILNFWVIQGDGSLRLLNEPSMRATDDKIRHILRLDYETFIASAFLQQGKADAFTNKTPAERKRTLSDILGLEQWAAYEDRTKERIKGLDEAIAIDEHTIREIDEELNKEPQYRREKADAEAAYHDARKALAAAEERLAEVASAASDLRARQDVLAGHVQSKTNYETEVNAAKTDVDHHERSLHEFQQILAAGEAIETGYAALQEARQMDSSLGEKLSQMNDLEREINTAEKRITEAQTALEKEKVAQEAIIAEAERLLNDQPNAALAEARAEITHLEGLEKTRDAVVDQIRALEKEQSSLGETRRVLTAEGKKLNERIERLQLAEGATCPLCGQALTEKHRAQVLGDIEMERDTMRATYVDAQQRTKTIETDIADHEAETERLAEDIKRLPALRARAGALEKQLDDSVAAQARRDEADAHVRVIAERLANATYAEETRAYLAELLDQRDTIGYDRATHDTAREGLHAYQSYEAQYTQLEVARSAIPGIEKALHGAQERHERLSNAIVQEEEAIIELTAEIDRLKVLKAEHDRRTADVAHYKTLEQAAYGRVVGADQSLKSLDMQRERKLRLETRLANRRQEKGIYDELKLAFGKNGVPAMIIETAIPELESSANDLLAKMTDGRMHLRLKTQGMTLEGKVTETLDIEIADDLGTRGYEMFSGGEAFRINFALRIALSNMLARRAGAHLRTLFIDEGFGTQDDDGRSKLVEAINAIQNDFDLILVITHMDDMRDSFPAHIVIEKTSNGSLVAIR
jgi:DNA repair protein SbcC/Rad50